jgi:hypothetical protein
LGDLVELESITDRVARRDSIRAPTWRRTHASQIICLLSGVVTAAVPSSALTAELTLVDYVPAVYLAELLPMLTFVSGQIPVVPPAPPVIANIRSDVTVMSRQVDGSLA